MDENGFRPLYLTLNDEGLAWSCPPEQYPKPHYMIRGIQQDILPEHILKEEIKITKMTKRGNIVLTDGYYKIKLSKSWVEENNDLWESIQFRMFTNLGSK